MSLKELAHVETHHSPDYGMDQDGDRSEGGDDVGVLDVFDTDRLALSDGGCDDEGDDGVLSTLAAPPTLLRGQNHHNHHDQQLYTPLPKSTIRRQGSTSTANFNNDSVCSRDGFPSPASTASVLTAKPTSSSRPGRLSSTRLFNSNGQDGSLSFRRYQSAGSASTFPAPDDDEISSILTANRTLSGINSTAAANSDIGFGRPKYYPLGECEPIATSTTATMPLPSPREQLRTRNLMIQVSTDGTRGRRGAADIMRGRSLSVGSDSSSREGSGGAADRYVNGTPSSAYPVSPNSRKHNSSHKKQPTARWSPTWKTDRARSRSPSPTQQHSDAVVAPGTAFKTPAGTTHHHCTVPVGAQATAPTTGFGGGEVGMMHPQRSVRSTSHRRLITVWQVITPLEFKVFLIALLIYWLLFLGTFIGGVVTASILSPNMLGEAGKSCNQYVPITFLVLLLLLAVTIFSQGVCGAVLYIYERPSLPKGRRLAPKSIFTLSIMSLLLLSTLGVAFYSLFIARTEDVAQKRTCGVVFEGLRATAITTIVMGLGGLLVYMLFYTYLTRRLHASWNLR